MTIRPFMFPARISFARDGTSSSLARAVMLSSFAISRSVDKRPQASSRFSRGAQTESTPASVTSRRMNGMTVPGRSEPCAKPQAATAPSYLICDSTFASVRLPTESTAPDQRSLPNRLPVLESSRASIISSAPRPRHEDWSSIWRHASVFQDKHTKHRGISGRTDCHRLASANSRGTLNKPIAFNASPLGIATVMDLSKSIAIHRDAISRLEARIIRMQHASGQIDAADKREFVNDGHLPGYREAILVVNCGMLDRHGDLSVHEV